MRISCNGKQSILHIWLVTSGYYSKPCRHPWCCMYRILYTFTIIIITVCIYLIMFVEFSFSQSITRNTVLLNIHHRRHCIRKYSYLIQLGSVLLYVWIWMYVVYYIERTHTYTTAARTLELQCLLFATIMLAYIPVE